MGGGEMRLRGGGEDGGGELRLPMARIPCCPRCAEHTAELRLVGWTQREPQHSPKPHSGGQRKQHEPAAAGSPWCRIAGDNGTTGQRDNGTTGQRSALTHKAALRRRLRAKRPQERWAAAEPHAGLRAAGPFGAGRPQLCPHLVELLQCVGQAEAQAVGDLLLRQLEHDAGEPAGQQPAGRRAGTASVGSASSGAQQRLHSTARGRGEATPSGKGEAAARTGWCWPRSR